MEEEEGEGRNMKEGGGTQNKEEIKYGGFLVVGKLLSE